MGRISQVKTKKTAADPLVNIATSITYQPMSRLVKNFTFGNTLTNTNTNTYTNDYELSQCQVKDGTVTVLGRSYARADKLNLTGITDQVTAANNQTLGYSAANRLNSSSGAYGAKSWVYDGVGNRTFCLALRMPTRLRGRSRFSEAKARIRAFFLALRMPTRIRAAT